MPDNNGKHSKKERDAFHEGRRDGEKGRSKSQGFVELVGEQIFGKTSERRSYENGNAQGRNKKKGR